jgi:hypothetical protein
LVVAILFEAAKTVCNQDQNNVCVCIFFSLPLLQLTRILTNIIEKLSYENQNKRIRLQQEKVGGVFSSRELTMN